MCEGGPWEGLKRGRGSEWGPAETWAHISACRLEKLGPCPQDPPAQESQLGSPPGSRGDMGASHPVLSPPQEKHRQLSTGPEASHGPTGPGKVGCYPPSPLSGTGWASSLGVLFSDLASASSPWGPTGRAVPGARGPPGAHRSSPAARRPRSRAASWSCRRGGVSTGCAAPRSSAGRPRALSVFLPHFLLLGCRAQVPPGLGVPGVWGLRSPGLTRLWPVIAT